MKSLYNKYILPLFLSYKMADAIEVSCYVMTKHAEYECSREIETCEEILRKLKRLK
jgi:hypothetical protein